MSNLYNLIREGAYKVGQVAAFKAILVHLSVN